MIDTLVSCLFSFFKTVIISLGKKYFKEKTYETIQYYMAQQ